MATPLEELQKMMSDLRTPGMTRTNNVAPGSISKADKSLSASFTGGDAAGTRRPGLTAGRSSVPTTNPAARVARANRILDTPAQASRTSTEASLNPQVGEALRLNLIEQERLQKNMQAPGSVNPVQFRAMMAERNANQGSVDSGLAALQGIREGSVAERGQNLDATTTLENRQMQEAGAFDRALLGLDATMLEGQFGAADTAARIEASRDPLKAYALEQLMGLTGGPEATAADNRNGVNAALGLSEFKGPSTGPSFSFDSMGVTGDFSEADLSNPNTLAVIAASLPPEQGDALLSRRGYVADPDSALGIRSMDDISAERAALQRQRQQQLQEQEKARKAAVAAYLRSNTLDPNARTSVINNQTRN